MDFRQIWMLYHHEIRSALRERSILVTSILIPIVMYPVLLWALFAGMSFIEGQADRMGSRIAIHGLPELHQPLVDSLEAQGRIEVTVWEGDLEEGRQEVAQGGLDLLVEVIPASGDASALPGNVQLLLSFDESRDRSRRARSRVEATVDDYRGAWIEDSRRELGLSDPVWADFGLVRTNLATDEDAIRFLLALTVPLLTLIMVALASFYPAIDATAGERERNTWETLMTVATGRENVAAAKYLYVATFGAAGGLLNLGALVLSLRWIIAPIAGDNGGMGEAGLPLSALPIIGAGTVLLGLLVAAGMLVFAIFARDFKEGQSMITPVYLLIILPGIFLQSPDLEFTPLLAAIPVANISLLLRDALLGTVPLVSGTITLFSMALCVALAVTFAQWVMRREEVLLGATEGGLLDFLKRTFRNRRSAA
jgi:sodium transport system permease protein